MGKLNVEHLIFQAMSLVCCTCGGFMSVIIEPFAGTWPINNMASLISDKEGWLKWSSILL